MWLSLSSCRIDHRLDVMQLSTALGIAATLRSQNCGVDGHLFQRASFGELCLHIGFVLQGVWLFRSSHPQRPPKVSDPGPTVPKKCSSQVFLEGKCSGSCSKRSLFCLPANPDYLAIYRVHPSICGSVEVRNRWGTMLRTNAGSAGHGARRSPIGPDGVYPVPSVGLDSALESRGVPITAVPVGDGA